MNIFVPVEHIMKTADGLSVLGSVRSTPRVARLSNEWSSSRRLLKERGRPEKVGSVPQIVNEGDLISVQTTVTDAETAAKFQTGCLRGFCLVVDESSGRIAEIAACDRGGDDDHGESTKLYKRFETMNTQRSVRPGFAKYMASMGFAPDGSFLKDDTQARSTTAAATVRNLIRARGVRPIHRLVRPRAGAARPILALATNLTVIQWRPHKLKSTSPSGSPPSLIARMPSSAPRTRMPI